MSLADQLWCPTSVQVTVLQARGLKIKGKGGTNDAFAVMQVGKEKYQTTVAEKSVAPVWKEEATFDLPQQLQQPGGGGGTERSTLHVHVLHRALVGPDKLLGQAVINLPQLSQDKTRSKTEWFKLLDKTGKADKDRGEVLVDIQFLRNNMTASMFDLSAAGKSKSRLGKFKDKVRGKKKDSDAASVAAPSFPQVLTDSEDEEGNGDCQAPAGTDEKKKKKKIKALFSPKSNLQRNMSQSMSVLPAKSSLSGSQSSGLNVDTSEGKKKFRFMIHKRSGSRDSSSAQQPAAEQSSLCINGSHVYRDEPQNRTSRIGSNFSLASSGHGSMEDVPGSSPPSVESLRTTRQYSPWTEEEEEISESVKEEDDDKVIVEGEEGKRMEEEKRRMDEEENARRKEEERILEEEKRRQEEEKRRGDEKQRWHKEEKARMEEERIRVEEERRKKEKIRLDNEERRLEEEKARKEEEKRKQEEKRRVEEEERKQHEEEKAREAEDRRKEMERRRVEEEERRLYEMARKEEERKKEIERRRVEEEKRARKEEEMRKEIERRVEEEERARKEEEMRKELESRRVEEEERARKEEEMRKLEEKRRIEEESFKKEMLDRQEQEKMMQMEEQRRPQEDKKKEKARRDEEEYVRMIKEMKKQEEEKRIIEERMKEEDGRIREEKKEREDERLLAVNTEVDKKTKNFPSEEQMKKVTEIKTDVVASLNSFDENFQGNPSLPAGTRSSKASVCSDPHRTQPAVSLLRTRTSSSDDKDHGGSQREKRPAPQPPGSTDIRTVLPQSSFQAMRPVSRSDPQETSLTVTVNQANREKGPAPARPCSGAKTSPTSHVSKTPSSEVQQEPITYGYNPFEDEEDDELTAQDEANCASKQRPPAAASHAKIKSSKKAHAPPLPELSDTSSTSVRLSPGGDAGPAVTDPDNHGAHLRDSCSISEAEPATPQLSGGKKDEPPPTKRRLLPVKPLNSLRQSVNQGQKDIKAIGILSDEPKHTKVDPELKGPYSQLTKAELISLVLKQENQLLEKDTKISELEQYIDNLLVRVMEEQPSILMSMNSLKKSV